MIVVMVGVIIEQIISDSNYLIITMEDMPCRTILETCWAVSIKAEYLYNLCLSNPIPRRCVYGCISEISTYFTEWYIPECS